MNEKEIKLESLNIYTTYHEFNPYKATVKFNIGGDVLELKLNNEQIKTIIAASAQMIMAASIKNADTMRESVHKALNQIAAPEKPNLKETESD